MNCNHCHTNRAQMRGLCHRCYNTPAVRALIEPLSPGRRGVPGVAAGKLPTPTATLPGTPERMAVLMERAERGEALLHPDDATRE